MASADQGLRLQGLSTRAGSFALGPIDLAVASERVLALLGPSGAGKTVLLETVAGFRTSTAGRVHLDDRDLTELRPEERRIGFVFQDAALFPNLSVRDNVRFALRIRGERRGEPADELLARFAVGHLAGRAPRTLSGGERQRVALARALAAQPRLLLLDEPLSSLDQPTREELRAVLRELLAGLHIPAIHVTHDRDEALSIGDDVAVIITGRVRQLGAAGEITTHPADEVVAPLLGWSELGSGDAAGGVVTVGGLRLAASCFATAPPGGAVRVFYRPEGVVLGAREEDDGATLRATVERIVPTAPLARVTLAGSPRVTALMLHRDLAGSGVVAGEVVAIGFLPGSVVAFGRQAAMG